MARIRIYELAKKLGVDSKKIITKLEEMGVGKKSSISALDETDAEIISESITEKEKEERKSLVYKAKVLSDDDESSLTIRAPIVTVMGHVDHGKTTLLDAIRHTWVVRSEAGSITQHIGAYKIKLPAGEIAFIDTPGHEAFTAMRARGAQITDIVVLVVAADDGVMPQTVEAINHSRAANVPVIVAINKTDKPDANPLRVKRELMKHDILVEELGGKVICIEVSAIEKIGIDHLLDALFLEAEMLELRANPVRLANGVIVEARLDKGRGPVATLLVKDGTLRVGNDFICGFCGGKVRALIDDQGVNLKEAAPSTPVEVLGFIELPAPGDSFHVVSNEKKIKEVVSQRRFVEEKKKGRGMKKITLNELYQQISEGKIKEFPIIIKGDVNGSVEALQHSLEQLSTDNVKLKVIHAGVGIISESDVMLAIASGAIIVGFHVKAQVGARELADKEGVSLYFYDIIYEVISDIKSALEGLLEPVYRRVILGRAEVRQIFQSSRSGQIAGSYVISGKIVRGSKITLLRNGKSIGEGGINSLKRFKEDVREVESDYECGIGISGIENLADGDIVEAYHMEESVRRLR
ncbi:translation initiation factor IF-2 [candidate division NPL-UPA2 bacterium Unc8]|uniref:Translation initiation factor IF-2 n=1 Tax=candidate division NPL-UPA2 bacterium Unc8 TaxID=1980939 RepID=A0A399FWX0_UNCN2|nr:Translation initiation factor IF-2 [Bacillota bacterium]MBT9137825.1 Translation initiation factor IF-2 [Bacillota bacterium]MBT9146290.1 Translation initiation factor IF-2 [Bacillota bacterium]RII00714.1 MAG: translation initiation factor IF-2 [candidate division NPL-UPA2 bacterium Unc8]